MQPKQIKIKTKIVALLSGQPSLFSIFEKNQQNFYYYSQFLFMSKILGYHGVVI